MGSIRCMLSLLAVEMAEMPRDHVDLMRRIWRLARLTLAHLTFSICCLLLNLKAIVTVLAPLTLTHLPPSTSCLSLI